MKKILCIVGTRPEAIKMAPVILALKNQPWAITRVLATAQHRQMLDQVLSLFGIIPDADLNLMQPNQSLSDLTSRLLVALNKILEAEQPDIVLAQGDTTTVLAAVLGCFYMRIPFCHVEAGLRTGDMTNPFPEEMNRVVASRLAFLHFAPTESSRQNLLREGISDSLIHVTGNTVIDALLEVSKKKVSVGINLDSSRRLILVTAHRRENFGPPFGEICRALRTLADKNVDIQVLYPVHPNPNIAEIAHQQLSNHPRIILCNPLDYGPFIAAMEQAYLILTDSGGVQEEAPALGKPVLVLRSETERPEAVTEGVVRLVGPYYESIVKHTQELLDDAEAYHTMAKGVSPYGDGKAAERIVRILERTSLV